MECWPVSPSYEHNHVTDAAVMKFESSQQRPFIKVRTGAESSPTHRIKRKNFAADRLTRPVFIKTKVEKRAAGVEAMLTYSLVH